MRRIRFWINRYFGFSRSETNGFFLLLLLTFLAGVAPFLLYTSSLPEDHSRDQADLDSLVAQLERLAALPKGEEPPPRARRQRLKKFDPNVLSAQEWRALGLSAYATANILKYRARAGGFRYKEQLARIYGLPPELYRELSPFIDLPSRAQKAVAASSTRPQHRDYPPRPRFRYQLTAFDINTADTSQLKKIRGIGSRLSGRIIRFRDKLGGFAHIGQLAEVYGLPPEVVDSLHKYVFIQEGFRPQQIDLNAASLQQLQAHPYLGYQTARLILAYRTQHGAFQSLEDLGHIRQISESQLEKMRPYLRL
jgi:DNA uptake protein ComE-like DNA-binding protein